MNNYEVLYILASGLEDAAREAFIEKYSSLVTSQGGEVVSINKWGNRKLAYPINYKNDGYYVLMTYTADDKFNEELKRQMLIAKGEVVRHMIIKK